MKLVIILAMLSGILLIERMIALSIVLTEANFPITPILVAVTVVAYPAIPLYFAIRRHRKIKKGVRV